MITTCEAEKKVCSRCGREFNFHELSCRPAEVCRECVTREEEENAEKARRILADWICSSVWD